MKAFRAFGAGFALVLLGFLAHANVSNFWGGGSVTPTTTEGPWLGDTNFNVGRLWLAHHRQAGYGYAPALSVSQTATQAACTQLNQDAFQEVKTSAGTGAVCLPPAIAGKGIQIGNDSGQTIDIFSSVTPGVAGGATDTINGTAGTSAYTSLTNGKSTECFAPNNGIWFCVTGQ